MNLPKPEDICTEMLQILQTKSPVLQPDFLPSKFQLDLKQLFPSQEDKIGSLIQECSQGRTQCSICSHPFAKSNESSFHFSYSWKIDFHQKTLQLSALQFLCKNCYSLRDLKRFLEFSIGTSDKEEMEELINWFVNVNGMTVENKAVVVQEIYCLAYSLSILTNNVKGLKYLDLDGNPLSENNLESLFYRSFSKSSSKDQKKENYKITNNNNAINSSLTKKNQKRPYQEEGEEKEERSKFVKALQGQIPFETKHQAKKRKK